MGLAHITMTLRYAHPTPENTIRTVQSLTRKAAHVQERATDVLSEENRKIQHSTKS
jgi:hypothetical protein